MSRGLPGRPGRASRRSQTRAWAPLASCQKPNGAFGGFPGALMEPSRSHPRLFSWGPKKLSLRRQMAPFQIARCNLKLDIIGTLLGGPRKPNEASQLGLKTGARSGPRWPGPPPVVFKDQRGPCLVLEKLPEGLLFRPGPSRVPPRPSSGPQRAPKVSQLGLKVGGRNGPRWPGPPGPVFFVPSKGPFGPSKTAQGAFVPPTAVSELKWRDNDNELHV